MLGARPHLPAGAAKPHHHVRPDGVVLGYSHLGMLAAARWLQRLVKSDLEALMHEYDGYNLRIVGESLFLFLSFL